MTNDNPKESKEVKRKLAMATLKDNSLLNLASSYLIENSQNEGENDKSAVDILYRANLSETGYPSSVFELDGEDAQNIFNSRQEGRRYSGTASEMTMMKKAAKVMQASVRDLKVGDLINDILGSKSPISEKYKDKYISELSEEEQMGIISTYTQYVNDIQVSQARELSAGLKVKGLEKMLCEPEKKE